MAAESRPDERRYREPQVTSRWRVHDRVQQVQQILRQHDYGEFMNSALLADECMTDDRIHGVVSTRIGGLLAAPLKIQAASIRLDDGESYVSPEAARAAADLGADDPTGQQGKWHDIVPHDQAWEFLKWKLWLGVAVGQWVWTLTENEWLPRLKVWHPQYLHWDYARERFTLQTWGEQVVLPLPGESDSPRSDGHWVVWGGLRSWMRGMVRSLALKYIARQWDERDWNRYNEKHGLAIMKGLVPQSAQAEEKTAFRSDIRNLANEGVALLPQGGQGEASFDLQLLEATSRSWETFDAFKKALDVDIAVAVLGQNLTTEVQGGSLAASKTHELTRGDKKAEDAIAFSVLRRQGLTHWAQHNYGDPELAPYVAPMIDPPADETAEATTLKVLGEAVAALTLADPEVDGRAILEEHGVPMRPVGEDDGEDDIEDAEPEDGADDAPDVEQDFALEPTGAAADEGADAGAEAALSAALPRRTFRGLTVVVESPAGSVRKWTDPTGVAGETLMLYDYGYVEGWLSGDGEELDVYLGPDESAPEVYVVHQLKAPDFKDPDEDKVFLAFPSADAARTAYLDHRNDGTRAFGGMSTIPWNRFAAKLRKRSPVATDAIHASRGHTAPVAALSSRRLATLEIRHEGGKFWLFTQSGRRVSKKGHPTREEAATALQRIEAMRKQKRRLRALLPATVDGLERLWKRTQAPGRAALKADSAARARADRYHDRLVANARKAAAKALAPDIALIRGILDGLKEGPDWPEQLKRRLVAAYPKMEATKLATIVQKVNLMAKMAGRADVADEIFRGRRR